MRIWRIAAAAHAVCDGEGARRYGSRWTPRGRAVVFGSATLSLAALERFVHADPDLEPLELVAIAIDLDEGLPIDTVAVSDLPSDWRRYPAPPALADFGVRWLQAARTVALSVPSVVIPHERNFILNPAHRAFDTLKIHTPEAFQFDPRMWK